MVLRIRCFARFGTICTILKNVQNTHGRVILLVRLLHGGFPRFLNSTNGTKSRNALHLGHILKDKHQSKLVDMRDLAHFR